MSAGPDDIGRYAEFINELQAATDTWDLDEPHAIIETDPQTGLRQVHGPYPDGYAALGAAERRRRYHDEKTGPPSLLYEVVPCFPADDG